MKNIHTQAWILLVVFLSVVLMSTALHVHANGPGYTLDWWTVDGGGATFNTGDGYSLGGTIGQPDAALWQGETYTLIGGFWGGAAVESRIYLPLVLRSS